jgi:uncharacterized membrane protein
MKNIQILKIVIRYFIAIMVFSYGISFAGYLGTQANDFANFCAAVVYFIAFVSFGLMVKTDVENFVNSKNKK